MSDLMLDVDQAGELKAAFRRGGYNNAEIKQLSTGDILAKVRDVLHGHAEIKSVEYTIDFGADPFLPDGWKVENHQKGKATKLERRLGSLYLDGKKIDFHLSWLQKCGSGDKGCDLYKELAKLRVLNANLLDYLLKKQDIIPESWKRDERDLVRLIHFWGTVYRYPDGRLCIRCLRFDGHGWKWEACVIDGKFDPNFAAPVLS